MGLDTIITIATLAENMLLAWEKNWDGQRISHQAEEEAERLDATYEDQAHKVLWEHMNAGERMQEAGDKMVEDIEARAAAAGIDVSAVIYLAQQYRDTKYRN